MTHTTDTISLRDAVAKLIKAKGRFHTEKNYAELVRAFDATEAAPVAAIQPAGEAYTATLKYSVLRDSLIEISEWARHALQDERVNESTARTQFKRIINNCTSSVSKADAIPAASAPAQPEAKGEALDPMSMPLPCDIKVGICTHGKGTRLSSLVARMRFLHSLVDAYGPKSFRYDEEHPNDGLNAGPHAAPVPAATADKGEFPRLPLLPISHWSNNIGPCCTPEDTIAYGKACILADRARQAATQDSGIGFPIYLTREQWGAVVDGLILECDRSNARKAANSESNSNVRADECREIIAIINGSARQAAIAQPSGGPDGWQVVPTRIDDAMIDSALAAHYGKRRLKDAGGPSGIDLTVNGVNYSGVEALRRMWKGALMAAPQPPSEMQASHSAACASIADDAGLLQLLDWVMDAYKFGKPEDRPRLDAGLAQLFAYIDTRTAALIDAASKERGGDAASAKGAALLEWPTEDEFIAKLYSIGWRAVGDAQHEQISVVWANLRAAIDAAITTTKAAK